MLGQGQESATQKFPLAQVTKVKIKKSAGNIEIKVAPGNEVWIEKAGPNCQTAICMEQGTLQVQETDPKVGENCKNPLKAFVPAYAKVDIESGAGNAKATNFPGPIEFELGAGNILCEACSGKVEADVGSGNIELTEFSGTADLDADAGNIEVKMAKTIAPGAELDLEAQAGNIKVYVPSTIDVMPITKTFIGKVKNDFGLVSNKLPVLRVKAEAKVGNIEINKI